MLTAYIKAALRKAHYEILPDGEGYFGAIDGLQGVWANAETLEACRDELREVLEELIDLQASQAQPVAVLAGHGLSGRFPNRPDSGSGIRWFCPLHRAWVRLVSHSGLR